MRSQRFIEIEILGDFIDSFIDSGTLFLVDADSRIKTYCWEQLLQSQKLSEPIFRFLMDCRFPIQLGDRTLDNIEINQSSLDGKELSTIQLNGWPTDINLLSNRFYVASEEGVDQFNFDDQSKRLDTDQQARLWSQYAYKVSPGAANRVAISAGSKGLVTVSSGASETKDKIEVILPSSYDCEWVGRYLVSNSEAGVFMSVFPDLPKKDHHQDDNLYRKLWNLFNTAKIAETQHLQSDYGWVAGRKLFLLIGNGELVVQDIHADLLKNHCQEKVALGKELSKNQATLTARSALFGTVIETEDHLYSVTENGIEILSSRPVSWRVFPRSKHYLNHLHIIEEKRLLIRAYLVDDVSHADKFGVNISDLE